MQVGFSKTDYNKLENLIRLNDECNRCISEYNIAANTYEKYQPSQPQYAFKPIDHTHYTETSLKRLPYPKIYNEKNALYNLRRNTNRMIFHSLSKDLLGCTVICIIYMFVVFHYNVPYSHIGYVAILLTAIILMGHSIIPGIVYKSITLPKRINANLETEKENLKIKQRNIQCQKKNAEIQARNKPILEYNAKHKKELDEQAEKEYKAEKARLLQKLKKCEEAVANKKREKNLQCDALKIRQQYRDKNHLTQIKDVMYMKQISIERAQLYIKEKEEQQALQEKRDAEMMNSFQQKLKATEQYHEQKQQQMMAQFRQERAYMQVAFEEKIDRIDDDVNSLKLQVGAMGEQGQNN